MTQVCTASDCGAGDPGQICPAIGNLDEHGALVSPVFAVRDDHASQRFVEAAGGLVSLQNPQGTTLDAGLQQAPRHRTHQRAPHPIVLCCTQNVDRLELATEPWLSQLR